MEELPEYARARHLLASLGMAKYQANLKRGQLTDATLLLWNDRRAPPALLPAWLGQAPRHRATVGGYVSGEEVERVVMLHQQMVPGVQWWVL